MSMRPFRRSKLHSCLIRIFFYGLFLAGPCFLTEAHSNYVRRQHECSLTDDYNIKKYIYDKYYTRERLLSVLGFSCIGIWGVWLSLAFVIKIQQTVKCKKDAS